MPKAVVALSDARPLWRMPDWARERISSGFPRDWQVVFDPAPVDGSFDGWHDVSATALAAVSDADVFIGFGVPEKVIRTGRQLRWVHTGSAGVRGSLTPALCSSSVTLTNSAGVHAPPMAESVIGMMLYFARGFDLALRAQRASAWRREQFFAAASPMHELADGTVGIVGYGGIGREVARRARSLGSRVMAVKRRPSKGEPGIDVMIGRSGLRDVLAAADYLVVALPETAETLGMIDRAAIGAMRPDAVFINVGRGRVVDEAALVEALAAGRLRGAGLDVFATEPLPADSPLWRLPNVLLTPHVSSFTRSFWRRETELIRENAERLVANRPLLNVVDKEAGY
jgi:phosphoglycerate dehydrogenase-like enzyme